MTFFSALLIAQGIFEPPDAVVIRKFYTSKPAYIVECNDTTRHILSKAKWDTINIGDKCPD
jgi:hypothetical protein